MPRARCLLQRFGVWCVWVYAPLALLVWVAVYESGIHATIAGVALGLLVPARRFRGRDVHRYLEHRLHPVSAYLVVPLFALAKAGIFIGSIAAGTLGTVLLTRTGRRARPRPAN